VIYSLIVVRRSMRQTIYQPVLEDWIWHAVLPLLSYSALLGAALALRSAPVPALFLVAGAALALIFIGIHNAWDTVAYIAVRHRTKKRKSR
jgi:fatty acid desaturase